MKAKTRMKFDYLFSNGEREPRHLSHIQFDASGVSAYEAFLSFESEGKLLPTTEPERLEALLTGKKIHGMTVQMMAEDFAINRLAFSDEIKRDYPAWVSKEIFAQAKKLARERFGFVPAFIANEKCFSEYEPT